MQILKTPKELQEYRKNLTSNIGLVPTMGALHAGHQSLMQKSLSQNTHTIVSIFVNPTQFGPGEDFEKYPRSFDRDCALCKELGVSAIFAPKAESIYSNRDEITLNPPKNMGYVFEGFIREGHFAGVLQIILKLFHLAQPTHAYFGQKDAQQLLILQRLVADTFLPITIIPCPTLRDTDGLALSSRNVYLSSTERNHALEIPRSLEQIQKLVKNGVSDARILLESAKKILQNVQLDYLALVNYDLQEIPEILPLRSLVLIAAKVGNTRLLDNLWF
ncbi:pantoate--beta-alanine ligase [Helicobacter mustelae]|uniref:Pantothenate synthetase n=1 Tax=Helicobacter mustelae (strain ATCC 43772 / CCUG 25715 / CIP 103759 / LMG 18044 / NCTC 12198 / R85-136P) TaxID=679897 RepID=D3UFZ9_HELM1|nr:pantoate--beta-alanine ligase [Helicobacter mustelae]CBG39420.1 putative pantoate--beta-alanine ligase [Helicobacter mustelae 12198]SQH70933.1 pantoate--beta-alanine ligase [Helicobacter mustelae]STP12059.1 pantoate--beta-alanine ligase [Helicobacter mustelae]